MCCIDHFDVTLETQPALVLCWIVLHGQFCETNLMIQLTPSEKIKWISPFTARASEWLSLVRYWFSTFESVDEILLDDYSNETSSAVLSVGTIYLVCSSSDTFWISWWNPVVLPFKWNLFSSIFTWYYWFSM